MKIWRISILIITLWVLCATPALAGWDNYSVMDGLGHYYVLSIAEDTDGNIWIGSRGGVSKFDGVTWRTYTTADGLPNDFVYSVLPHTSGDFWFGGFMGATRFDGVSWRTYTTEDGLADDRVWALLEDSGGDVWFATRGGGASRFDGQNWTTYTTADGLGSNFLHSLLEDSAGNIWVGGGNGVARYDGVQWQAFTTADGLGGNNVYSIEQDSSGNLWFATDGGATRFDGVNWVTYTTADGLVSDNLRTVVEDDNGNLWFGTYDSGVSRFDGQSWRTYSTADGLAGMRIACTLFDSSGNLWFGFTGGGVSRYDRVSWRNYNTTNVLQHNTVRDVFQDSNGNLWFATGNGVTYYDGLSWHTYTTADGLVDETVTSILEDSSGDMWFGTHSGVSRFDGVTWENYDFSTGFTGFIVQDIMEDSSGNLWFGMYQFGVNLYDGANWYNYTEDDGLGGNWVEALLEDSSGNLWFATSGGATRYDGLSWTTYTTADGLAGDYLNAICEDRSGNLWLGTGSDGVSRYDGVSWLTYSMSDGLADNKVRAILEDRFGNLWFGTGTGGVSRFDGVNWGLMTANDGLGSNNVLDILEDKAGDLWFGTWDGGVQRHEPDRIPPHTVISPRPASLSVNPDQTISFAAAFREVDGVTFSHSFNGSPWSEWSPDDFWQVVDLPDGEHVFSVKARDKIGNVDPTEASCTFEIDATPPLPVIASPTYGQAVRDSIAIVGTASDLRFERYRVEARSVGAVAWDLLAESSGSVTDGALAGWNTLPLPDGDYEVRLSVTDTLGLTGTSFVGVTVDNHAPWVYETAPAFVSVVEGGNIYTTNGDVRLYFPPRAFMQDTEIRIDELGEGEVPDTLENGAVRFLTGHEISWSGASLSKPAMLEMYFWGMELPSFGSGGLGSRAPVGRTQSASLRSVSQVAPASDGALALYVFGADSTWRRLGGTVDALNECISSPITEAGRYAIFTEASRAPGVNTLSALSIAPRVFSPSGAFANVEAGIGFTLGRSGAVTVKVYNRAGRLVREVVSGRYMGAGSNLVRWDGRDRDGRIVEDGLYLVTVEAMGEKQVKTLAVIR